MRYYYRIVNKTDASDIKEQSVSFHPRGYTNKDTAENIGNYGLANSFLDPEIYHVQVYAVQYEYRVVNKRNPTDILVDSMDKNPDPCDTFEEAWQFGIECLVFLNASTDQYYSDVYMVDENRNPISGDHTIPSEKMDAKTFLLSRYFRSVPWNERELWYETHEWPAEIVRIMEEYKNQK